MHKSVIVFSALFAYKFFFRVFLRAKLRLISPKGIEIKSCEVFLAISHRIYWKVVKSGDEPSPKSLFDFRNQSSLELCRVDFSDQTSFKSDLSDINNAWNYVNKIAKPEDSNTLNVIVKGILP